MRLSPRADRAAERPDISGLITLWDLDPVGMTPAEFSAAPWLLYHGTHRPFVFERSHRYDHEHVRATAGGWTLGMWLYLTADRADAEALSLKRLKQQGLPVSSGPIVAELRPFGARMLDLREPGGSAENLPFPRSLFDAWHRFLDDLPSRRPLLPHEADWYRMYLDFLRDLGTEDSAAYVYDILGTDASGRPFLFEEFRSFMIDMGIDGMIYDEGSRHFYGIERLVSYVFYGLDHIGDYRTWNPLHIDASARTDAILAP